MFTSVKIDGCADHADHMNKKPDLIFKNTK